MEKASKFSYKVSKKEKILIDAIYLISQGKWQEGKQILEEMARLYPDEKIAHLFLAEVNHSIRNYEEAIIGFNKVIELDPFSKEAYSKLAYVYDRVGRYDEAIKSINRYIELAPVEANPYDTRGDIYALRAEVDKAIESYKRALEIKSDFAASVEKLGLMYLFKREYGKAERYFLQYGKIGGKIAESSSRANLALIPLSQGKYDLALKTLEKGIAADELDKLHMQQVKKYQEVAEIRAEKKEFDKALQNSQKILKLMAEIFPEALYLYKIDYGYFLAEAGQIDSAVKVSNEVKEEIKDKTEFEKSLWYLLEYKIKYHSGDIDEALKEIAELAEREKNSFRITFFLAKTYLERGMIGEAVQEFEKLTNWNIMQTVRNPLFSSKIPYFLGICYEKSGWEKKAIEKYEEFLEIWKDADPGIAEVEDVKKRLAVLKSH